MGGRGLLKPAPGSSPGYREAGAKRRREMGLSLLNLWPVGEESDDTLCCRGLAGVSE